MITKLHQLFLLAALALLASAAGGRSAAAAEIGAGLGGDREIAWGTGEMDTATTRQSTPGRQAFEALEVSGRAPSGTDVFRILELDPPQIVADSYVIKGKLRHENVGGKGYLEMYSYFGDGTRYFTRTLDSRGLLKALSGSSDWREFALPFYAKAGMRPTKIEVFLRLPEGGRVWLAPSKLIQPAGQMKETGAWWSDRQGGLIGGVLGTTLGLLGGVIGMLSGRGKHRRLVLSIMTAATITCAILLLVGVVAVAMRQPYGVWYPLVLTGGLGVLIIGGLMPSVKRRFAEMELRKMSALDAVA